MTLRKTLTLAAGASLLTMALPLVAKETQPTPDMTTSETPAPPEVPSTPAPVEAPPPPAPPETPAPPSPPPAQAETMPMDPAAPAPVADPAAAPAASPAPGTTPGAQDTSVTNPAPAPQASYPLCSRTVTDQCQQREGRATRRRPR